jgi:hypothetical protein
MIIETYFSNTNLFFVTLFCVLVVELPGTSASTLEPPRTAARLCTTLCQATTPEVIGP